MAASKQRRHTMRATPVTVNQPNELTYPAALPFLDFLAEIFRPFSSFAGSVEWDSEKPTGGGLGNA
jgi:hypothetical protein